ncbi:uncharacterized protein MAM_07156 [Metarhizium album ARSEF 1941]|uniref:Uncharacterized protein n=1 Tax=Metarhizium album (strain ARSEF 1941) TaxID=1081103 RepID=A0A0B2WMK4_METAS|nr:uncharacterized protein MAM_07156 [Metarhizium album ARSEF 1941]KHN94929.1 hypothetical protein MAM_07156 [Metarhizium album ARSEF 1941]
MSDMHHDRDRSSKHKHHKSSKSSKPRTLESSNSGRVLPRNGDVSFLFVVTELEVNFHLDRPGLDNGIRRDEWLNVLPPNDPALYAPETPQHVSRVMRFRSGQVTPAGPAYYWARAAQSGEGYIAMAAGGTEYALRKYKSASVFSCNPSLPIITLEGDARTDTDPDFNVLQFLHRHDDERLSNGVSLASFSVDHSPSADPPPVKFVAGRHASWIPSLVPEICRNPYRVVQSLGLGGELPIVIGLMAFHASRDDGRTVEHVFLGREGDGGFWRNYRWLGTSPPPGYPNSEQESPRGYLVHICLDPENQPGSTFDSLATLEWAGILVQG